MDKAVEKAVEMAVEKTMEKAMGVFKRLTLAEIEFVKKTGLEIPDEKKGEKAARLSEIITNFYSLTRDYLAGKRTLHDISMDEEIRANEELEKLLSVPNAMARLVKEMEKLREGGGRAVWGDDAV